MQPQVSAPTKTIEISAPSHTLRVGDRTLIAKIEIKQRVVMRPAIVVGVTDDFVTVYVYSRRELWWHRVKKALGR